MNYICISIKISKLRLYSKRPVITRYISRIPGRFCCVYLDYFTMSLAIFRATTPSEAYSGVRAAPPTITLAEIPSAFSWRITSSISVMLDESCLTDIPTQNKVIDEAAKRDLLIALITLKYTQSNSVCYAKDGQAIGIGAGQQSRVHCTRLAGSKADVWHLRQHPKVLALPFKAEVRRPDRDNAIDVYISEEWEDLLETDDWKRVFTDKPEPLSREEKKEYLKGITGVSLGSDAFFPFGDNVERAHKSGVSYIAQSGGSIRDDNVIETADKYDIAMAFTHIRLFHH